MPDRIHKLVFDLSAGFIREFWVDPAYRVQGHGSALLKKAERFFTERGVHRILLTTDTAEDFYLRRGYIHAPDIRAKNGDAVFVKRVG